MQVQFSSAWDIDMSTELGRGAFGAVFPATGPAQISAVAKFVRKEAGSTREELIGSGLPSSTHLVPIIDSGETDSDWVLVMPRATQSLEERLRQGIPVTEAISILSEVAEGLSEIDGIVVHRDLKPGNVLLLDDHWAISDFGISRYAEAATSADTHKYSFTPAYAAPEQWNSEHATGAADIYAFGVMAFQMCMGELPYLGPSLEDFRDQHLHEKAPPMALGPRLSGLITECLYKSPSARPNAANLSARLANALTESERPGLKALAGAQRFVVEANAEQERLHQVQLTALQIRQSRLEAARAAHLLIIEEIASVIEDQAPAAIVDRARSALDVRLGAAQLELGGIIEFESAPIVQGFMIDAYSEIGVAQAQPLQGYSGRQHSLYYCNFDNVGQFAWYEVAFMVSPWQAGANGPLSPESSAPIQIQSALQNGMGTHQIAWPFEELHPGELTEFVDRWLGYFALAAQNQLRRPQAIPEKGPIVKPRAR
jgi:hypothetical protein